MIQVSVTLLTGHCLSVVAEMHQTTASVVLSDLFQYNVCRKCYRPLSFGPSVTLLPLWIETTHPETNPPPAYFPGLHLTMHRGRWKCET